MTTLAPLFQKANLIFGMGMLEMGITFSFRQLILDSAVANDIQNMMAKALLPEDMNAPSFVKELAARYRGEKPTPKKKSMREFWQGAKSYKDIGAKANDIAGEIINNHRIPTIDRAILNEIRRIVVSAE